MQDRRAAPSKPLEPEKAPPGLQVAIRQLGGNSWERRGSAVIVRGATSEVLLSKDTMMRIEWHQGNPDGIAEILEDARRPNIKARRRRSSGKRYSPKSSGLY
jgi:hypothetical protein